MRTSWMSFYKTASYWRLFKKTGTGGSLISNFFFWKTGTGGYFKNRITPNTVMQSAPFKQIYVAFHKLLILESNFPQHILMNTSSIWYNSLAAYSTIFFLISQFVNLSFLASMSSIITLVWLPKWFSWEIQSTTLQETQVSKQKILCICNNIGRKRNVFWTCIVSSITLYSLVVAWTVSCIMH